MIGLSPIVPRGFEQVVAPSSGDANAAAIALGSPRLVLGSGNAGLQITARDSAYTVDSTSPITISFLNAGASQSLSVAVSGTDIEVTLATNASSIITSTASQVKAAIEASTPAKALVVTVLLGSGANAVAAVDQTALEASPLWNPGCKWARIQIPTGGADLLYRTDGQAPTTSASLKLLAATGTLDFLTSILTYNTLLYDMQVLGNAANVTMSIEYYGQLPG